ncbi:protein Abitram-like [Anneissia japonica]|uniref:protein Abitram-like n=1 Tax=Anneissia japonica TaxID=1529436 RepID=UPI00142595D2|nr:protein Abitram-like [Anneissia japonica]
MKGKHSEDFCILKHSNRVCILTIAASHPIIRDRKTVTNVDFQVTPKMNRLDNKVSGKSKKGGQWLNPSSPLCCITCEDETKFTMYSCIRGKLAEVNEKLIASPNLLKEKYTHAPISYTHLDVYKRQLFLLHQPMLSQIDNVIVTHLKFHVTQEFASWLVCVHQFTLFSDSFWDAWWSDL